MTTPDAGKAGIIRRARAFVRRRPLVSTAAAVLVAGLGAWLFFGFFGFHTLFFDEVVDEADPFATTTTLPAPVADDTTEDPVEDVSTTTTVEVDDNGDDDEATTEDSGVATLVEGTFVDRAHPTVGIAKVISDGNQRFLRLEGFKTDNGPDLNVYLATGPADGSPGEFVDLGNLKGNVGDQNYEIGDDVDLAAYTSVFIWCVRFSVAFGAAELA